MTPKRQPGFGRHEPEALQTPLFVRIPKAEADKLARAAFEQKRPGFLPVTV